ncbi:copper fist DNA binding domain-containing protein [Umbelopsis sp. AD052]|nr:copper fist DNA binding domain-containing protein [Umbelopsis sp. AD052]
MIIINNTKYSCMSCVKGHRSSRCTHSNRPLVPIRRKGRPATQCETCRELRRTRHIHIKCLCKPVEVGTPRWLHEISTDCNKDFKACQRNKSVMSIERISNP